MWLSYLTAVLAIYGAALSTYVLLRAIRERREKNTIQLDVSISGLRSASSVGVDLAKYEHYKKRLIGSRDDWFPFVVEVANLSDEKIYLKDVGIQIWDHHSITGGIEHHGYVPCEFVEEGRSRALESGDSAILIPSQAYLSYVLKKDIELDTGLLLQVLVTTGANLNFKSDYYKPYDDYYEEPVGFEPIFSREKRRVFNDKPGRRI